jgi:hypothetical protein
VRCPYYALAGATIFLSTYHLPFYRHIWALTMTSPLPLDTLYDDFMSAGISQRSHRSDRYLVNLRFSCSRCEVESLSLSDSVSIHLGPFTRFIEDSEFIAQT